MARYELRDYRRRDVSPLVEQIEWLKEEVRDLEDNYNDLFELDSAKADYISELEKENEELRRKVTSIALALAEAVGKKDC
jgi:predicted nuclease with TOPRIM domain